MNANLDDEAIEIHVAPGQKLENWHAGDYRLTDAQQFADQSRTLSLTGTMLPPGADRPFRQMPTLRIVPAEADYSTVERLTWRFARSGQRPACMSPFECGVERSLNSRSICRMRIASAGSVRRQTT